MAKKNYETEYRCSVCGKSLTEDNCRENGYICFSCESKRFKLLEEKNGTHIALFIMCGIANLPLEPMIIPEDFAEYEGDKWKKYYELLTENNKVEKRGKLKGFFDSVCDIREIFGAKLSYTDFSAYVSHEQEYIEQLEGTEDQRDKWETRPLWNNFPMTSEIYNELDRRYDAKVSRYKGMTIDEVLSDNLKKLCKLELTQDYLLSIGDIESFNKIQKSIDSIQASEQLRKKDERPKEELRIDALVLALENAGLMENGELLTYDELLVALRDKFIRNKKYNYSLDVADQVLLDIINSMRANADLMQVIELPEELELVDEYGEFEEKETDTEKEAKRYLGLTKVNFVKTHKNSDNSDDNADSRKV